MKIYIDFDGVFTLYNYDDYKDDLFKKDPSILLKPLLFPTLPPHFIILTRVATEEEAILKTLYLHRAYPHNKIITTFLPKTQAVDPRNAILIDDYNLNLDEWRQAGGIPIKFVNNVNSPRDDMLSIDKDDFMDFLYECSYTDFFDVTHYFKYKDRHHYENIPTVKIKERRW